MLNSEGGAPFAWEGGGSRSSYAHTRLDAYAHTYTHTHAIQDLDAKLYSVIVSIYTTITPCISIYRGEPP